MNLQIFQVDAFTDKQFGGNPAAVVPLEEWLPDNVLLGIAAENNLSETAYFIKDGDGYQIRWFTPTSEIDLCGHATLASGYVIFNELGFSGDVVRFISRKSGELSVAREGDRLVLDFPAYPFTAIEQSDELADAVAAVPMKVWEAQGNMVFLRLDTETKVRELVPNFAALAELDYDEIIVTARGDTCDFASRMFAPRLGIPEDPVTGAIHCSLIPYWAEELGKDTMFARQVSARGGELFCEARGARVRIGGNAVLYLKGEIFVGAGQSAAA